MLGFNGGLLGKRRVPNLNAASGLWFPNEQSVARREVIWPTTNDPFFSSVSLLLPMNGSDGSTTFTDSSSNGLTVTANGNAQISTAESKWGGASGIFDGTGDFIDASASASPDASSSFTLEFWIYPSAVTGADRAIFDSRGTNATGAGFVWFINTSARLQVYGNNGVLYSESSSGVAVGSSAGWQHVALVCSGTTWTYWIDGSFAGSFTATATAPQRTRIGARQDGAAAYTGYIDDFRITKSVARYTSNFTPPTAPFPDA
jgi:hypothetical protein